MSFFSHLKNTVRDARGFTMIELLVVITILGILAVAVLSAINPIEQINRGRDTGSQSDAEQLIGAIERFNAFQGYYPWVASPADDFTLDWIPVTNTPTLGEDDAPMDGSYWVSAIIGQSGADCTVLDLLAEGTTYVAVEGEDAVADCTGTNEVKPTFVNRISAEDYNPMYAYNAGTPGSSTYVCFEPISGAFKQQALDRCNGTLPTDFPVTEACGTAGDEMICLP